MDSLSWSLLTMGVLFVCSAGAWGAAPKTAWQADVCVVGGGSGGIGAALAAARAGASVILVERQPALGGTSARAFVCNWEPGPGDAFAKEIYERLRAARAGGVTRDFNADRKKGPFGLWLIDPALRYEQSLRRAGLPRSKWHGVVFDPAAFQRVVLRLLEETGRCRILLETRFVDAFAEDWRVKEIVVESADGARRRIRAKVFVDCTGGVALCRAAGCEVMLGAEPRRRFDEPDAPERADVQLNAISLCYRIRPSAHPARQPAPEPPVKRWPHSAHVTGQPDGALIVNPLALLEGRALLTMGYEGAMAECRRRVQAHWRWLQGFETFSKYEFDAYAPMLGIRESYRVVGEYVLTERDLLSGLSGQPHKDIVAVADHAMDVHGARGACREIRQPYGVSYRCLVPRGWLNLLAACRGASFSHIAASSCRLSRTMLALGHAAGLAAAQAARAGCSVAEVDVAAVQRALGLPASR